MTDNEGRGVTRYRPLVTEIALRYERMVGYIPPMFGDMLNVLMRDELRFKVRELVALYDADVAHNGVVWPANGVDEGIPAEDGRVPLRGLLGPPSGILEGVDDRPEREIRALYETKPEPLVEEASFVPKKLSHSDVWIKEFGYDGLYIRYDHVHQAIVKILREERLKYMPIKEELKFKEKPQFKWTEEALSKIVNVSVTTGKDGNRPGFIVIDETKNPNDTDEEVNNA